MYSDAMVALDSVNALSPKETTNYIQLATIGKFFVVHDVKCLYFQYGVLGLVF